jgi:hypothetical protein
MINYYRFVGLRNVNEFKTPFDFAQGDCQTERSRSLISLIKQHFMMNLK